MKRSLSKSSARSPLTVRKVGPYISTILDSLFPGRHHPSSPHYDGRESAGIYHNYLKDLGHRERTTVDCVPNEVLLKIFEELSYFDLKLSIPLVCKRFRSLVDSKSKYGRIDQILFRDLPRPGKEAKTTRTAVAIPTMAKDQTKKQEEEEEESDICLHPALGMLNYKWSHQAFHSITFLNKPKTKLHTSSVAGENAVSPPVESLYVGIPITNAGSTSGNGRRHRNGTWMILLCVSGTPVVSIGDVMNACTEVLTQDLSDKLPRMLTIAAQRQGRLVSQKAIDKAKGMTWGKMLGKKKCEWGGGFHTVKEKDGVVYLFAGEKTEWAWDWAIIWGAQVHETFPCE